MKKICLLIAMAMLFGCEKSDDQQVDPPQSTPPPSPQISIKDAHGSLVAINTTSIINLPVVGEQVQLTGTAVAAFENSKGERVAAGSVECMGEELKNENNSYFFQPGFSNPSGLEYEPSGVSWKVEGNGEIPGFTYNYNRSVPEMGGLSQIEENIDRNSDFTITIDMSTSNFTSADSVLFNVIDAKGKTLMKTKAPSVTTHTFSATEMKTLSSGTAYVQVAAYNYQLKNQNNYQCAFINMGVITETVTLK